MYFRTPDPEDSSGDLGFAEPAVHCGDAELYQRLHDEEFAPRAYEVLAAALVGYAYPVLRGWLANGEIFSQCAAKGRPVWPTDSEREHLYRHPEEVDDIIYEALGEAIVSLRSSASKGEHKWDPAAGASLTTYFVGACVLRFPNVFRRWSRDLNRRPSTTSYSDDITLIAALPSPDDVELQISSEILTEEMLSGMPPHVRRIVELKMNGMSYADIAARLGISTRAVEGVLHRYRDGKRRQDPGAAW